MLRQSLLFATLLLGLAACKGSIEHSSGSGGEGGTAEGGSGGSGGAAACDTPPEPGAFEIGTGEECFSRVADGDEVPLMNGPQGGYHMWLALGCQDCQTPTLLRFGAHDPATGMPLTETYDQQEMVPLHGEGFPQAAGIIVTMPGLSWDPEGQPPLAKGTHVVLWAKAYDGDQLLHEAQVEVVVGDIQTWDPCADDPNSMYCQLG